MSRHLSPVPDQGDRTVLYVRVSALMGRDGETFHSPELQTRAMRDLISRRGLREVAVVEDIDVSGRTFAREGIQRILIMARAHQVDVVALYDLSRLGRNTAESLRTIAELRELGVTVVSTIEQIDDTPEGQFQLGVFLGMAQLYSDQISRRWTQVHDHRASQGLDHGGAAPLGYVRGSGGQLAVDPVWGPRVREIFQRYANGDTLRQISIDMIAIGCPVRSVPGYRGILTSPVYRGMLMRRGVAIPARHERLIGDALWRKVQRRRARDAQTPSRVLERTWSLAGLVWCVHCDGRIKKHTSVSHRGGVTRRSVGLVCARRSETGNCEGIGAPRLAAVEAEVLVKVRERVSLGVVDEGGRLDAKARKATARSEATRLRREITALERALGRHAAARAKGTLSDAAYVAGAKELEDSMRELHARLDAAEAVEDVVTPRQSHRAMERLLELWGEAAPVERGMLLAPIVRAVRVRRAEYVKEPISDRVDVEFFDCF